MPNIEYLSLLGNPACPDQLSAAGPETTNNPQEDYQHYRFVLLCMQLCIEIGHGVFEIRQRSITLKSTAFKSNTQNKVFLNYFSIPYRLKIKKNKLY